MLLHLPSEIVLRTLALLELNDLKRLCETSRILWQIASPLLYNSLVIPIATTGEPEGYEYRRLLKARWSQRDLFRHVQHVYVSPGLSEHPHGRCIHDKMVNFWADIEVDDAVVDDHPAMAALGKALLILLSGLKEHGLQSFSWEIETCVPREILGPRGYLSTVQASIESIHLSTRGTCDWKRQLGSPITVGQLKALRKFAWRGVQLGRDREHIYLALRQISHNLTYLELDAVASQQDDTPSSELEPLSKPPYSFCDVSFPSLQTLSLSGISCAGMDQQPMRNLLDFQSLRVLDIQNCARWDSLIAMFNRSCLRIRLTHLHISTRSGQVIGKNDQLAYFLNSFCGLVSLHLGTISRAGMLHLHAALKNHEHTLEVKRFDPDTSAFGPLESNSGSTGMSMSSFLVNNAKG